ncbi:MAG TPA: helix-turn-helix domain-containing protein [Bryobacteraceae bacterium]|nr:helix-turn-helix domain-containing protein [Bryobacteraceae bacterium]
MSSCSLTTGKAAQLCSVKPDTVLKWIKKGRLPAIRTAGGHYRVEERDVLKALTQGHVNDEPREERPALCGRPVRCWEYMNQSPGTECQDCIVYKVHATWCFRLVQQMRGTGHAARFCGTSCQECPYYRRVHQLPTNVLVITRDEGLIRDLAAKESHQVAFRFARRGYDASAIVEVFRPAYVIFDQVVLDSLGINLLEALASDPRTKGVRILVAVRKGGIGFRVRSCSVYATVQEPFQADEIVALINRTPIEALVSESAEK